MSNVYQKTVFLFTNDLARFGLTHKTLSLLPVLPNKVSKNLGHIMSHNKQFHFSKRHALQFYKTYKGYYCFGTAFVVRYPAWLIPKKVTIDSERSGNISYLPVRSHAYNDARYASQITIVNTNI